MLKVDGDDMKMKKTWRFWIKTNGNDQNV